MPIPNAYKNDPDAPWEADPVPECVDCDRTIHHIEDHAEWCEFKGTQEEVLEVLEEQQYPTEPEDRL